MTKDSIQKKIDEKTQELKDFVKSEQAEVDILEKALNERIQKARGDVARKDGAIKELQDLMKEME